MPTPSDERLQEPVAPLDYCDYEKVLEMQDACNPSGVELSLHDWAERIRRTEGPQAMRGHPLLMLATMKLLHLVANYDCSADGPFVAAYEVCKTRAQDIKI